MLDVPIAAPHKFKSSIALCNSSTEAEGSCKGRFAIPTNLVGAYFM